MTEIVRQFKAARRAGVPIVAVETSDAANLVRTIMDAMNGTKEEKVILQWDLCRSAQPLTKIAGEWINEQNAEAWSDPVGFLMGLHALEKSGLVFMFGAHALVRDNPAVIQGIWNLRDPFKTDGRTLVLVGPIGWKMPSDIKDDIVVLSDPLPDREELKKIAVSLSEDAKIKLDEKKIDTIADAVCGLSAFGAEQVIAMSTTKDGVSEMDLWDRKRKAIEQTPGLSVWRGGQTFDDIGGYDNVKNFLRRLIQGKRPPKVILFIDEIEKAFAGAQGDTSGVSQDFHGTFLSWAEDNDMSGCVFVGPSGSGKTAVSHAVGAEANILTIGFDFNGMKASLVGESGARLRGALSVVKSIGGDEVLALATCNSFGNISPELKRRFKTGTFYFDLPTDSERVLIWKVWLKKLGITDTIMPNDANWTGAEIRQCCDVAYRLSCSLVEAAKFIVPVAKSAAEALDALRKQASGRFLSASYEGTYQYNDTKTVQPQARRRMM